MANLLERMKKNYKEREQRFTGSFDPALYNLFDLQIDDTVAIRFLPGMDALYDEFWTTRKMVPMEFADPDAPNDPKKVIRFNAPCLEMYGPQHEYRGLNGTTGCPLLRKVRILYKEAEAHQKAGRTAEATRTKDIANKHWTSKTTQYFYQGFVISSPLKEENPPENPIRIFQIVKKLHDKINDSIFKNTVNPFKNLPTGEFSMDDVHEAVGAEISDDRAAALLQGFEGRNFILKISAQGLDEKTGKPFRDWSTASSWAHDNSGLSDTQIEALAKYGFHDLRKRLPPEPSPAKYELMSHMMDISLARAAGVDIGMWDREWEKPLENDEPGCVPLRSREDREAAAAAKSSVAVSGARPTAASAVASRLAGRGKSEPAPEATQAPVAQATPTPVVTPTVTPEVKTETPVSAGAGQGAAVTDVLAGIRAKLGAKKAPASA